MPRRIRPSSPPAQPWGSRRISSSSSFALTLERASCSPYKGAAPAITDVLGGQIQVHVSAKSALLPLIQSGRLRALAVTSADRWPELPDIPTVTEIGLPGFPTAQWFGLLAPQGTPNAVIGKLNSAVAAWLKAPDSNVAFAKIGLESHVLSAHEFGQVLLSESQLWEKVAREAGVKLE